jgi:peroxin-1
MCLIKVSEALAECIGLKDGARVLVRAKVEVAKAKMVTIEPASEDDWEILELNADYLEQHLLARVGFIHPKQSLLLSWRSSWGFSRTCKCFVHM